MTYLTIPAHIILGNFELLEVFEKFSFFYFILFSYPPFPYPIECGYNMFYIQTVKREVEMAILKRIEKLK